MKYVILDNIRSAHNVGAIFRTCDGAGVDKLFLCGYTPTPIDRFGRSVAEVHKTSLGAVDFVAWEYRDDVKELVKELQSQSIPVVVIEQTASSESIYDVKLPVSCALVFGNEIEGVQSSVCKMADRVVEIPMRGKKESLNVGTTVGVVLFQP